MNLSHYCSLLKQKLLQWSIVTFLRGLQMAGRFEGLSDAGWSMFSDIFPEQERKRPGMPACHPRKVMNSLLYILIVGCRWCDLPGGRLWASKSSAHRRLKTWYSDGTIDELKARILGAAQNEGLISWKSGAVDGSFSPWKRRRS
jgi:transposase